MYRNPNRNVEHTSLSTFLFRLYAWALVAAVLWSCATINLLISGIEESFAFLVIPLSVGILVPAFGAIFVAASIGASLREDEPNLVEYKKQATFLLRATSASLVVLVGWDVMRTIL